MTDGQSGSGRVLRLRNLAMIENIRRAESPAWRERLEQRQVTPVGLRASRSHAPRTKAAAERCGRPKRLTQYPWNSLIVNSTGSHEGPLICTTPVSAPC